MSNFLLSQSFIKWLATATLIVGTIINAVGVYPYGPLLLIMGSLLWLTAAIKMNDKPLIITNLIMGIAGLLGIGINYSGLLG